MYQSIKKIRIFRNLKDGKEHPFEPKVEYPTSINTKYAVVLNVTDTYIFKSSTRANLIVYLNADGTKHNYIKGEELGASANRIMSAMILEGNQPFERNIHYVNNITSLINKTYQRSNQKLFCSENLCLKSLNSTFYRIKLTHPSLFYPLKWLFSNEHDKG